MNDETELTAAQWVAQHSAYGFTAEPDKIVLSGSNPSIPLAADVPRGVPLELTGRGGAIGLELRGHTIPCIYLTVGQLRLVGPGVVEEIHATSTNAVGVHLGPEVHVETIDAKTTAKLTIDAPSEGHIETLITGSPR